VSHQIDERALPREAAVGADAPFVPLPYRVLSRRRETPDVVTLTLAPVDAKIALARPGQFTMLTAFGVGEAAISVSGEPLDELVQHTVRDVGSVSHALCASPPGALVGVRGPFGTDWGLDSLGNRDAVVVAGGIGLAPLSGAITRLVRRQRAGGGRVFVAVGAKSPDQVVLRAELGRWQSAGARVLVTVDTAPASWNGRVGLVTQLLAELAFDPDRAVALVCGPEVMIRFTARELVRRGVAPESVRLSLERNMQCGIALCGHCQLGTLLLCRDGPVVTYDAVVERLLAEDER
jgi:NAD(P)H-flavin reductase